MESYIRGALTPIYKSQLGNTTRGGDVVGSQVPSLLMQSKVPILFHLYAPWCTASSRFQPIFEELSRHYKDRVLFVGMDASTNEVIILHHNTHRVRVCTANTFQH